MKKILLILLILPFFFFCAFKKKEQPYIILSSSKITKMNVQRLERVFASGQRIHYAVVVPDGFKYSGLRMQISSQSDKTSNWGFTINQTNDIYVAKTDRIYNNYVVIQKPGRYIIQFFYLNNKRYPFIHKEFMVQ